MEAIEQSTRGESQESTEATPGQPSDEGSQSEQTAQPQEKQTDLKEQADQPAEASEGKKKKKKKKSKGKNKEKLDLSGPDVIVERILKKSSFLVPNLSDTAAEKFAKDKSYRRAVFNCTYKSTISKDREEISIFPTQFVGQVVMSPAATTSLDCIYHKPEKRRDRPPKGWKKKRQQRLQYQQWQQRQLQKSNGTKADGTSQEVTQSNNKSQLGKKSTSNDVPPPTANNKSKKKDQKSNSQPRDDVPMDVP